MSGEQIRLQVSPELVRNLRLGMGLGGLPLRSNSQGEYTRGSAGGEYPTRDRFDNIRLTTMDTFHFQPRTRRVARYTMGHTGVGSRRQLVGLVRSRVLKLLSAFTSLLLEEAASDRIKWSSAGPICKGVLETYESVQMAVGPVDKTQ